MTVKWSPYGPRDTPREMRRDLPTPRHPNRIPATVDPATQLQRARAAAAARRQATKPTTGKD